MSSDQNLLDVYIRVRPPLKQEIQDCLKLNKQPIILHINENQLNIEDPDSVKQKNSAYKCKQFEFGNIINDTITNEMIYKDIIQQNILQTLQDSLQLKIITYGQTGSGKSFTLFHKNSLFYQIANELSSHNQEFSLSLLEVNKEKAKNLLTGKEIYKMHFKNINLISQKISNLESIIDKLGDNKQRNNIHLVAIFTLQSNAQILLVEVAVDETKFNYNNIIRKYSFQNNLDKKNSLKPMFDFMESLANQNSSEETMLTTLLKNFNNKTIIIACVSPTSKSYQGTLETLTLALKISQRCRNSLTQVGSRQRTKSDVQDIKTPQKMDQKHFSFTNSSQILKSKILSPKDFNVNNFRITKSLKVEQKGKKNLSKCIVSMKQEDRTHQSNLDSIRYSTPTLSSKRHIQTQPLEQTYADFKDSKISTASDISRITEMSEFLNQSSVMDILVDLEDKNHIKFTKKVKINPPQRVSIQRAGKQPIISIKLTNFKHSLQELYKLIFDKQKAQDSNKKLLQISKINILLYEYKLNKWQLKPSEEKMITEITYFATKLLGPQIHSNL